MLSIIREKLFNALWLQYQNMTNQPEIINNALAQKKVNNILPLDHFAVIDLTSKHSGIHTLKKIFESLNFTMRGKGYLPDKKNDFVWLATNDIEKNSAHLCLPQVVVADFRIDEMPNQIQSILLPYIQNIQPFPFSEFQALLESACANNSNAYTQLETLFLSYFNCRDWPVPTIEDYQTIAEYNELLAWVLVFGRCPNHYTFSIHLMDHFNSLNDFLTFIQENTSLSLNQENGIIKGDAAEGIAQASTVGTIQSITLSNGNIKIPTGFMEFVWRYPKSGCKDPKTWDDYFTGFIAHQANFVIESLY